MTLLCGPIRSKRGVRQIVDFVDLQDNSSTKKARAGVFESLESDLHKFHLTDKRTFTLNQSKTCARQLFRGLREVHKKDIIHTGPYLLRESKEEHRLMDVDLKMENIGFPMLKTKPFWRASPEAVFEILDLGVGEFVHHLHLAKS